ncbi:MAG: hypothetical protein ACKN81_00495, partial [Pirellulaceae bacterium]
MKSPAARIKNQCVEQSSKIDPRGRYHESKIATQKSLNRIEVIAVLSPESGTEKFAPLNRRSFLGFMKDGNESQPISRRDERKCQFVPTNRSNRNDYPSQQIFARIQRS